MLDFYGHMATRLTSDSCTLAFSPAPTLTVSLARDVMRKSLTPTTHSEALRV